MAAFPEGHPRSPDPDSDIRYFVEKCRAGADFAITQMFFYPEDYLRLRDRVAARGCDVPIIPGIMPVTSVRTLDRIVVLSGAKFPPSLRRPAARGGRRPRRYAAGSAWTTPPRLCDRLLAEGVPGCTSAP